MESSSWGKRERGTKAVAVKLPSKKVDWRLSVIEYFDTIYPSILSDNKDSESILSSTFIWPRELRLMADPVIILILMHNLRADVQPVQQVPRQERKQQGSLWQIMRD